jgi:hypothetical protein
MSGGWIGVDLDGTLAHYDRWRGPDHVGAPVRRMRIRVVNWLAEGREVRIFTARKEDSYPAIRAWCLRQFHRELPITNQKDFGCVEYWDDRAVQVIPNTGRRADGAE